MVRPYKRFSGVRTGPLGERMIAFMERYCPYINELYVTSAYRPNETTSHHSGLWYNGSRTAAVDFGAYDDKEPNSKDQRDMGLVADWLFKNFWDLTVELIHTQPHNDHYTYVKHQRKVGAYATADHVNHIHWATSAALMDKIEARARAKWGSKTSPTTTSSTSKYNSTAKPIFGADIYDFTINAGLTENDVKEIVQKGGLKFLNAKIAEVSSTGGVWVHTKALRMLTVAKEAGLPFPMGFVVPRSGVSAKRLMDTAEAALDKHCPWWRKHPTFSIQVDAEHWSDKGVVYDRVPIGKGIEVARYIQQTMKRRVAAVYAPAWAYRGQIDEVKAAGFRWWASNYSGSGSPRDYREMYAGAGGKDAPGWGVVDGVKPFLNQYCSDGRVPGYGGNLVMTAYEGTETDFAKALGVDTTGDEFNMTQDEFRENVKYAIAELLKEAAGGETKRGRWVRRRLRAIVKVEEVLGVLASLDDKLGGLPTLINLAESIAAAIDQFLNPAAAIDQFLNPEEPESPEA